MKGNELTTVLVSPQELIRQAMPAFQKLLPAQRYLAAWLVPGQPLEVLESVGFDSDRLLVSEAISLSVLEEVAQSGEGQWSGQGKLADGSLTFMLAGIKAYVCVPVKMFQAGGTGLLYADDLESVTRFSYTDFANALNFGRRLGAPAEKPSRVRAAAAPVKASLPLGEEIEVVVSRHRIPIAQQVSFFRSMATFMSAGIPLLHGLHALSVQGESKVMREFSQELYAALLRGQSLSEACQRNSPFRPMVVHMLACAERSGQLSTVLNLLSEYLEETHSRRQRLLQALVYPAFVLLLCVLMAVVLPTFILRDQLQSYAHLGDLPWATKALLLVGNLARSGWTWAALALLLGGFPLAWKKMMANLRFKQSVLRGLLAFPPTRRITMAWHEVSLATTLALQLKSGVSVLEALHSAIRAVGSPLLEGQADRLVGYLRDGETLSFSLSKAPGVGRPFCQMLRAGEESGHVVTALEWLQRNAKLDFDHALETALSLVEPFVMLFLGVVVGIVTLGSLLPSLKLLEQLG